MSRRIFDPFVYRRPDGQARRLRRAFDEHGEAVVSWMDTAKVFSIEPVVTWRRIPEELERHAPISSAKNRTGSPSYCIGLGGLRFLFGLIKANSDVVKAIAWFESEVTPWMNSASGPEVIRPVRDAPVFDSSPIEPTIVEEFRRPAAGGHRSPGKEIETFSFEGRTLEGTVVDDIELISLLDICNFSGVKNASDVASRLEEQDKRDIVSIDVTGRRQVMTFVTEAGFYDAITSFRMRKDHPNYEIVRRFKRWVFADVLPTLRKTSRYEMGGGSSRISQGLDLDAIRAIVAPISQSIQLLQFEQQRQAMALMLAQSQSRSDGTVEVAPDGYYRLVRWAKSKGIHLESDQWKDESDRCTEMSQRTPFQVIWRKPPGYRKAARMFHRSVLERWYTAYCRRNGLGRTQPLNGVDR